MSDNYRKIETRLVVSNYAELMPPTHQVTLEEEPAEASDLSPFDAEYTPAEHGMVTVDLSHIGGLAWVLAENLSESEHDVKVGFFDGDSTFYVTLMPGEHCKVKHDTTQVIYLDLVTVGAAVRARVLALDAAVSDIPAP